MKKSIITLIIFAFALSSCGIFRKTETHPDPRTHDEGEGVVINGVRWATRNVDMPGTFAETPESVGMFFQWNNKRAWSAVDERVEGWRGIEARGTAWYAENDPCPAGWRVPTHEELQSLVDAENEWVTQNGVYGRLFGTAPYQVFLPVTAWRRGRGMLGGINAGGFYWSSTMSNPLIETLAFETLAFRTAYFLQVLNEYNECGYIGYWVSSTNRANGFAIRCVSINKK